MDADTERYLLLIWTIANLIVGILVVHDFGVSFDEPRYYIYAGAVHRSLQVLLWLVI